MDRDQSGYITYKEFYNFFADFQEIALNDSEIQTLFKSFDKDMSQTISVTEFGEALRSSFKE